MQAKQTLRVEEKDEATIVKLAAWHTSYIDSNYYEAAMSEQRPKEKDAGDDGCKNYPVKVEALRCDWIMTKYGKDFFTQILASEQLDIYAIPAIQMYVEHLYAIVKRRIKSTWMWPYYAQLACYYGMIYLYESQFQMKTAGGKLELEFKDKSGGVPVYTTMVAALNILLSLYPFAYIGLQITQLGRGIVKSTFFLFFFTRTGIDALACIGSIYVSFGIFVNGRIVNNDPKTASHHYRVVAAIVCVLLMSKALYFLKLNDRIAPLIFILVRILSDIRYFMFVFLIILAAYMVAFYLIGQVQLDQVPAEADNIRYATVYGSFQYMWYISIGELSADDALFDKNKSTLTYLVLWLLFVTATFLVLIHMLNMLIAIMSETFTVNNESEQETRLKEHLQFVVDNWWTIETEGNRKGFNYLVCAWAYEEDEEEVEILKDLQEEVGGMRESSKQELGQILQEIKKIKQKLEDKGSAQ